jgi:hypothetical protein
MIIGQNQFHTEIRLPKKWLNRRRTKTGARAVLPQWWSVAPSVPAVKTSDGIASLIVL